SRLFLEAVPLLRAIDTNSGRLRALAAKIIGTKAQVEDNYNQGLKALFLASREGGAGDGEVTGNAMRFVISGQIYDHLERVADCFVELSNDINSMIHEVPDEGY